MRKMIIAVVVLFAFGILKADWMADTEKQLQMIQMQIDRLDQEIRKYQTMYIKNVSNAELADWNEKLAQRNRLREQYQQLWDKYISRKIDENYLGFPY